MYAPLALPYFAAILAHYRALSIDVQLLLKTCETQKMKLGRWGIQVSARSAGETDEIRRAPALLAFWRFA